jgi:hypothetical protein
MIDENDAARAPATFDPDWEALSAESGRGCPLGHYD